MKVLSTLSIRSRFIRYSKCSTRKREKVIRNEGFVDTVDTKQVRNVLLERGRKSSGMKVLSTLSIRSRFEMFYSKEGESHPE